MKQNLLKRSLSKKSSEINVKDSLSSSRNHQVDIEKLSDELAGIIERDVDERCLKCKSFEGTYELFLNHDSNDKTQDTFGICALLACTEQYKNLSPNNCPVMKMRSALDYSLKSVGYSRW